MSQLPKPKLGTVQQQNAELKARLARADRLIAQLRAETSQLRTQLAQWQRSPTLSSAKQLLPAKQLSPAKQQDNAGQRSRLGRHVYDTPMGNATRSKRLPLPPQRRSRRQFATEPRLPLMRLLQRRIGAVLLAIVGLIVAVFLSLQAFRVQPFYPHSHASVEPSSSPPQPLQPQPSQPQAVGYKPPSLAAMVYNVSQLPQLEPSKGLQAIVDGAVALAASKDLPTEPLSITLVDLKTNQVAGYQNQTPRYPASVVKLFWLVACEAQLEQGVLLPDPSLGADLTAMVVNSDNDAASRVFDRITQTTSGNALSGTEYDTWLQRRLQLNHFFQAAGYNGLSISQKNYPIYALKLEAPDGRELQMRDEQQQPIRSLITTDQAARLLHEIFTGKAVSGSRSQEMMALLLRDLQSEWKKQPGNAIAGFLGESLPPDIRFASKIGMTTKVRHEVALVESKDGKTSYILAVFGTDPAYSQNTEILPAISNAVFTQMTQHHSHASGLPN